MTNDAVDECITTLVDSIEKYGVRPGLARAMLEMVYHMGYENGTADLQKRLTSEQLEEQQ